LTDRLTEYLEENPQHKKYIVDGQINWNAMGIDLEYEKRTNPSYVDEVSLFIDVTVLE
tara:strand:+ start:67 stop:240 length:174 start_codon:yes stop_codon:yes gene_type:complete